MSGSSPLTRGKLDPHPRGQNHRRLIPAHTGKTLCDRLGAGVSGAHPRSRGENAVSAAYPASLTGSSPLARGKLAHHSPVLPPGGLVPAHTGKTPRWCPQPRGARAHPRSRGENVFPWRAVARTVGSSPLTRGKLPVLRRQLPGAGLIPAHAGKTASRESAQASRTAHPRSRGENLFVL